MLKTRSIRKQFPIYSTNKELVYLDSASSTLKLKNVALSTLEYYEENGVNIHRGVYNLAYDSTNKYEETRLLIARFVNSKENEIIFTKGTTDSLNKIAKMLETSINPGDEIVTSELEHHSSILPWIEVAKKRSAAIKYIPLTKEGKITINNFKKVITNKTKIVVLTHMSNVTGNVTPINEISVIAKSIEAIVVLDCAQSAVHEKIDVTELNVDFLAFSLHKMFGPSGVGVLYGKESLLNSLHPVEFGGEMVSQVSFENATYKNSPLRHEAGTQNIAGVIATKEVISFINEIGLDSIRKHSNLLMNYTMKKLKEINGVSIYNQNAKGPIIVFNVNGIHPHDAATFLDQEGICVRAGHHCAQLINNFFNVDATVRASFSIYNNKNDCDKFIEAVKKCVSFFNGF